VAAHHDISPAAVQGANNDGSGIAVMLHLAEIFAVMVSTLYSGLQFATDGEEWACWVPDALFRLIRI